MRVAVLSVLPLALRLVAAIPMPQDDAPESAAGDSTQSPSLEATSSSPAPSGPSGPPAPGGGAPDASSSSAAGNSDVGAAAPSSAPDPLASVSVPPWGLTPLSTSYPPIAASPDPNTGKAFKPKTVITLPNKDSWWTLDKENTVEWVWHEANNQSITLVLSNLINWNLTSNSVMNIGGKLDSGLGKFTFEGLTGIEPGGGYVITMVDPTNDTMYYAESDTFEIKAPNATQYGKSGAAGLSAPSTAVAAAAAAVGLMSLL